MKLKKVIKYLDGFMDARIWVVDLKRHTEEVVFEGMVDNIPKSLRKMTLIKAEDNEGSEAIFPCPSDDPQKPDRTFFRITLVKE